MAISCSLWLVLLALLQVLLFVDSLKVSTSSVTRNGIVGRTLVTNYCSSRNICSISCSRSVDRTRRMDLHASLILGVNKYSHDTSCCFVDSDTGKVLFTQAKERITGKKHDGGAGKAFLQWWCSVIRTDS